VDIGEIPTSAFLIINYGIAFITFPKPGIKICINTRIPVISSLPIFKQIKNYMKGLFTILIFLGFVVQTNAAVDTVNMYSSSMFMYKKCVVITPGNYTTTSAHYPVVYLLHGYGGNYANWVKYVSGLQQLADENQLMIVCPDGNKGSWYYDSPVDLTSMYETHISNEVPRYIDSVYRTIKTRKARAITGLSMGGHGAMFIAFRHAQKFGACGSMSGALMSHTITRGYNINKILGDTIANQSYYQNWSVINLIEKYPTDSLAIIIDCGINDPIYEMTKQVHNKMVQLKIPHDYTIRPGKHDWAYWKNAIQYQLLFFKEYFKNNN
jgi:S-formylglutathione hydrolase FrmB